jgi:ribonuclease HII
MQFGVDEAGKGPVVGSMFVAAVRAPESALPDGIDDSKRLTDANREALADRLRGDDRIETELVEVPPERIDAGNMNDLTVAAHAEAIDGVARKGDHGHCDAADVDAERFGNRVENRTETDATTEATHGADAADALVGAASVLAKSERERHVETLEGRFGEIGSGYPSDPTTRTFLRRYFDEYGRFPPPTRTSWATCASIRAGAEQTDIGGFGTDRR